MLFSVNRYTGYQVVEMNKHEFNRLTAKLLEVEEFKHLTDKMFRCLVLFADYKSPLRQHPRDQRFKLAALEAGYKIDNSAHVVLEKRARDLFNEDNKYWNAAYEKYMAFQHDEDRELVSMVDSQIDNIRKLLNQSIDIKDEKAEVLMEKRNKLIASLPNLVETKRTLSRIVGKEEEIMGSISDDESDAPRERSLIDQINEEELKQRGDETN
jgi:hypothetical protein